MKKSMWSAWMIGHSGAIIATVPSSAMQDMSNTLSMLVNACQGDHRPHCPILKRLETDPEDEDLSIYPRRGAVDRRLQ